jgi:nucleoside-diphosphate-sugar epimerase
MRVLITGAGGFIGTHLVIDQLRRGREVTAVDLHVNQLKNLASHPRLKIFQCDFRDRSNLDPYLRGHEVCFHLASAHLEVGTTEDYYWGVNVSGTKEFIERSYSEGIDRFIHVSSVGVFGDVKNPPANESHPCSPTNIYEKTKLAGEQEIVKFAIQNRYSVGVIRPAWVYGPYCPRTKKLLRTIQKGRFVIFGSDQHLRHPVYISDCVRAMNLCVESSNLEGQTYIIAGPTPVTIRELIDTAAEALGVPRPSLQLPLVFGLLTGFLTEAAFKPLGRQPPFSRRSVDFFTKDNAYDISKAKKEIGYEPRVDLLNGLLETIHWQNEQSNVDLIKEEMKNG